MAHDGDGSSHDDPNNIAIPPDDVQDGVVLLRFLITIFKDKKAKTKEERVVTVAELAALISSTKKDSKDQLPWLKLARFGDKRTKFNCLRHDANVVTIYGIECDYDAGLISFEDAVRRAREAGVLAILYTSASYRPEDPHWRALFPFGGYMQPAGRGSMMDRANALLGGGLSTESWTLSQSYYFGRIDDENFRMEVIDGDMIDARSDLGAVGKAAKTRGDLGIGDLVGTANIVDEGELTPYGEAALRAAATNILMAPNRTQERTLNAESFSIGRLAGAGGVPAKLALEILLDAAAGIPDYDPAWPWSRNAKAIKVRRGFAQGLGKPRPDWAEVEREIWRRFEEAAAEDADVC